MDALTRQQIKELEALPLDEARRKIAAGYCGAISSPGHVDCSAWLAAKEAALRDEREEEALSISRKASTISERALAIAERANEISEAAARESKMANRLAIMAAILAIIAIISSVVSAFIERGSLFPI